MDNLVFCLNAVTPVFLLIATGTAIRSAGLLDENGAKQINKLSYYIFLPLVMFRTAYTSALSEAFDLGLLLLAIACITGIVGITLLFAPCLTTSRGQIAVLAQASYRSNIGMVGIAFASSLSGEFAAAQMGVMVAILVPLYNVFAVILFSVYSDVPKQSISLKSIALNIVLNPMIMLNLLGFAFSGLGFVLPHILRKPLFDLASAGSVVALLGIGAQLSFNKILSNSRLTLAGAFTKLIFLPAVGTVIAVWLGMRDAMLCVLFLLLATPNATGCASMADIMGADGPLAAEMVVFSTAASAFTIFFGFFILKSFGFV